MTENIEKNQAAYRAVALKGNERKRHIHQVITYLHPDPGEVFEIRAWGPHTPRSKLWEEGYAGATSIISGFFDDPIKATEAAAALDAIGCEGIYVTLNSVNPALLARANNRLGIAKKGRATSDTNILTLRWFLIDIDVKRPAAISTTDEEHLVALDQARWLKELLSAKGWPDPLHGDSGNGAHLVYRLPDLANVEENINLLKGTLNALNDLYRVAVPKKDSADYIHLGIDCSVFNPSRVSKLYGTFARKGDNIPDRPHRQAQVIDFPSCDRGDDTMSKTVSIEMMQALVAEAAKDAPPPAQPRNTTTGPAGTANGKFDLAGYLDKYGVRVKQVKPHQGATLHVLDNCLFDESHAGGEAAIGQAADGKLFYQCFHDSCKKRVWSEAREKISGADHLGRFMEGYQPSKGPGSRAAAKDIKAIEKEMMKEASWKLAQELFPRIPFPWHVLPPAIIKSLKRLARSCASAADHLPGVVLAILASALGRAISVSPKSSWGEPAIIWVADIRESGEGKTPTARALLKIIEKAQIDEHRRFKSELEEYDSQLDQWKSLPKKEQQEVSKPRPPRKERGYMVTNLTLEGMHDELDEHVTGGVIVVQDELSSFVSSQNEYKTKGSDRESWLLLHDGNIARVKRAGKTVLIKGGRVSLFGGIQPGVFKRAFAGEDGVYLEDGTLFRFLLTYERSTHHALTNEPWDDADQDIWEALLGNALDWAGGQIDEEIGCVEEPFQMLLKGDAQTRFFDWRNSIDQGKGDLHPTFRGFLPKAYGYAIRLTGLIHALWQFHQGETPNKFLTVEDVNRGIHVAEFYLGQTVDALRLIEDAEHRPADTSDRVKHLAVVLDSLREKVDSGRLAVGFIHERFNADLPKEKQIGTPKAMGALLRSIPLTIGDGLHDFRGQRRVSCVEWDGKIETFLKQSLQSLQSLQSHTGRGATDGDIEETKSPKSPSPADEYPDMETLETLKKQSLHPETHTTKGVGDVGDVGDVFPNRLEPLDDDAEYF